MGEPLVFRSAEVGRWKAVTRPWTKQFLRDTYGRSPVMPRSPQVLAVMAPDRKDNGGSIGFKQFSFMDSNRSIFDRSMLNASEFEEEDDLLLVDELWDDEEWDIPSFFKNHTEERGLFVGPSGHGLPFHQQGDVWQATVAGKQLWMLHPPRGLPADWEIAHPRNVFKKALANEDSPQMLHCLLEPGDVIFVPRFWHLATLNVGESVGLGGNRDVLHGWSDEDLMAKAAEEREAPERNGMLLELAATTSGRKQKWKDALKDAKLAHLSRPSDPFIVRRFIELLLAVNKNTSAAQVADKYLNRTFRLHKDGWMDKQELSAIYSLIAYPMNANEFNAEPQRMSQKALTLVRKAARLDPNNWNARIMTSHNYLLLGEVETSFKVLHDVPSDSQGARPALELLKEMCSEMPEELSHLQQRYCPQEEEEDDEGAEPEEQEGSDPPEK